MRRWHSNLYLSEATRKLADSTLRATQDGGSTLWPACDKCSAEQGIRFAVESYQFMDSGKTAGGEPYTDIRARCHGAEDVFRIEGMKWEPKDDSERGQLVRIAAMAAIPFFAPSAERKIPAVVFRSFVGAH